jgi:hypothetical protein
VFASIRPVGSPVERNRALPSRSHLVRGAARILSHPCTALRSGYSHPLRLGQFLCRLATAISALNAARARVGSVPDCVEELKIVNATAVHGYALCIVYGRGIFAGFIDFKVL